MTQRPFILSLSVTLLLFAFQNCGLESPTGDQSLSNSADQSSSGSNPVGGGADTTPTTPVTTPATTPSTTPVTPPPPVVAQDKVFSTATATPATFDVPQYNMISVKVWGAGGGGGSVSEAGKAGGLSSAMTVAGTLTANGGVGGGKPTPQNLFAAAIPGVGGAGGTSAGGSLNTSGRVGASATIITFGIRNGGAGGAAINAAAGISRGAGGNGGEGSGGTPGAGGGGSGGYTEKVFVYPALPVGSQLKITVGAGGAAGPKSMSGLIMIPAGLPGTVGRVEISVR